MAKTYNLRSIKHRESYTFKQIGDLLKIHFRTAQGWKQEGLKIISQEKPYLVMGYDLKEFLSKKLQNRQIKLQPNEFYCMKCKKGVRSAGNKIWIELSGKTIGNQNFKELTIKGICEFCDSKINKFSHEGKLEEIKKTFNTVNLGVLGHE